MSSSRVEQYKGKKFGFGNTKESRFLRIEKYEESRKKQRTKTFNKNRDIQNSATNTPENKEINTTAVPEDRLTKLLKWKAERERCRRIEQTRKKPPFVVGKVRHKIYSPINADHSIATTGTREKLRTQCETVPPASLPKRITRATQKRLINKATEKKITSNSSKTLKSTNKEKKNEKRESESFAPKDHKFQAPKGLSHIPLFGRVAIQSMSPARISELRLSSIKPSETSRKSGTAEFIIEEVKSEFNTLISDQQKNKEFIIEEVNNEESNVSLPYQHKDEDDSKDSSIEPVLLKLSSDEEETHTYFDKINSDNNDANNTVEIQHNSVHNNNNNNNNTETPSRKNESISMLNDSSNEPAFFSPYVISSRGKDNARKEEKLKRGFSLNRSQSDDIPTKDTVMKTLNISVEEEERTAKYFRFLLTKEIDRLNELCKKWADIKEDATTTEDGQYEINQAIGQTKLLINKKFERFRGLVADCETGKGEMLVTSKDLQGFWDMMYMEVIDCDTRFQKLEKLRSQNWLETESPVTKVISVAKKKAVTRKKVAPTKSSSIRAFLAAKKKNFMQQSEMSGTENEAINYSNSSNRYKNNENDPSIKNKRRSSAAFVGSNKQEKSRPSLLQKIQLSETSKDIKSPLTVIKVSQMCKTPDIQLNETISYINSNQTPGKGILKQPKNSTEIEPATRSVTKVNFVDHVVLNEIPVDEETQLKQDLSTALSRIDSFDFDSTDEVTINAGKKLTFEDNSFEESENDKKQNSKSITSEDPSTYRWKNEVPVINIQNATPFTKLHKSINVLSPRRNLRKQNSMDISDEDLDKNGTFNNSTKLLEITEGLSMLEQTSQNRVSIPNKEETNEHDESIRVLRNRVVTSTDTPRPRRSSRKISVNIQEPEHKENKTPVAKTRRKSSVKKADLQDSLDKMSLDDNLGDKRKSLRSVKFFEKDCSSCVPTKSALPMTPHIRRSKVKSTEQKINTLSEDLISWETPEKPPDRVRRSRNKKKDTLS